MIIRNEICDKLENIVKNLKYVKHCIGCEGLDLNIKDPKHHPSVELTQKCNLNCFFCYSKLKKVKRGIYGNLEEAKALTISQYGEPLFDIEGVKRAILLGKKYNLRVDLQTNGVFLNEEILEEFKELGLDIVMISLSCFSKESYRKITGKDYFDKVKENIKIASKYFHTIIRSIYLPNFNEKELIEMAKYFDGIVDEIMIHHPIAYNNNLPKEYKIKDLLMLVDKIHLEVKKTNVSIKGCLLSQLKEMDGFILANINYNAISEVPEIKREYHPLPW
ncbi:radical SAM protein [Methanocaldococcus villosus KIN24-T80]|uniref:Radical SAM protein n=1 Tax=Methanocaldococcus villosus KIN24-T80 TaxID=1069083 RepID=N6W020_9EURY|nr:radical SAM protein [Methanocaldococcus villosus]ENN96697.1 radical SAM protein [Methanocaldococcus villosus KIN24-T80]